MNTKDAKEQVRLLRADEDQFIQRLIALPSRNAIVFADGLSQPAEIRMDVFTVPRARSAEEILQHNHATRAWIHQNTVWSPAIDTEAMVSPVTPDDEEEEEAPSVYGPMLTDHLALLRSIEEHPTLALRDHFRQFQPAWTDTHGYRIANALRKSALTEDAGQLQTAGRYKALVRLTTQGKEVYARITRS